MIFDMIFQLGFQGYHLTEVEIFSETELLLKFSDYMGFKNSLFI